MAVLSQNNLTLLLFVVALCVSITSLAISSAYSLPFPPPVAAVLFLFAVIAATLKAFTRKTNFQTLRIARVASSLTYVSNIIFIVSASLSSHYVFSRDVRHCAAELRRRRWFQSKDETIRSIQNLLRCCGFNSPRDQAYPFPSKQHDALSCQRNSTVKDSCGILWERQLQLVALLCMVAGIIAHIASNLQSVESVLSPDNLIRSHPRIPSAERDRLLQDAIASTQDREDHDILNNP